MDWVRGCMRGWMRGLVRCCARNCARCWMQTCFKFTSGKLPGKFKRARICRSFQVLTKALFLIDLTRNFESITHVMQILSVYLSILITVKIKLILAFPRFKVHHLLWQSTLYLIPTPQYSPHSRLQTRFTKWVFIGQKSEKLSISSQYKHTLTSELRI